MNKSLLLACLIGAAFSSHCFSATAGPAMASTKILGGDKGAACSMLLCLSDPSGKGLAECAAPLKRYFDMDKDKRPGFLRKCPKVSGGK